MKRLKSVAERKAWSWKDSPIGITRASLESAHDEFVIGLAESAAAAAPDDVESLTRLGEAYTRRGRYAEGLEVDRRLAKLCPANPVVHYNLACSLTLTGHLEEALDSLARAIDLGYGDAAHMEADKDLEALRDDPRWKDLVARATRKIV